MLMKEERGGGKKESCLFGRGFVRINLDRKSGMKYNKKAILYIGGIWPQKDRLGGVANASNISAEKTPEEKGSRVPCADENPHWKTGLEPSAQKRQKSIVRIRRRRYGLIL